MIWRRIKSAPQTGRAIVLWDPYFLARVGKWVPRALCDIERVPIPQGAEGVWKTHCPYKEESGEVEVVLNPTHWKSFRPPQADDAHA